MACEHQHPCACGESVAAASFDVEPDVDGKQSDSVKQEGLSSAVVVYEERNFSSGMCQVVKAEDGRKEPSGEARKRRRDDIGEVDFEDMMGNEQVYEREVPPAVWVGLKPDELAPSEKVRFKDVMKRRSRIAEYLECRNFILKLWMSNVKRHLLVTDCGVSATVQPNESPRSSLIRDIHEFLDYHGYINFGIVKRLKTDSSKPKESLTGVIGDSDAGEQQNGHAHTSSEQVPMDIDSNDGLSQRKGQSKRKEVVVVGAGPAGLIAARHLQRMNFNVTVLEARDRVGGRVFTDRSTFSVPVDLGASIITGTEADAERRADPSALLCRQLGLDMTRIAHDCPIYDKVTGEKLPADLDAEFSKKFNDLLDETLSIVAQTGDAAMRMSLEDGLEQALVKRKGRERASEEGQGVKSELESGSLPELERRVIDWHIANLEYGCAAPLCKVSLPYWSQDESYGGFAGPHSMIKGGYATLMESLSQGLNVMLGKVVTEISYTAKDVHAKTGKKKQVRVKTDDGELHMCDAVLVTVPLGCLKAQTIKFVPQLPSWKSGSIDRLGFGTLNKVVLEFETVFWDKEVDIFGVTSDNTESRGRCFMFWNLVKTVAAPVLIALVVGKAAVDDKGTDASYLVSHAVDVLRKLHGRTKVPEPKRSKVTNWGLDPYSRGAYSYVAVGASGEDYDILGRPVEDCLFFAGEATCKEHPDTVGGALMSGLKQAVRILDILENRGDLLMEAEQMDAAQMQPDGDRNELRDMQLRIQAAEFASTKRREDGIEETFTRADVIKDMFQNAKTIAGRLFLVTELEKLSTATVKAFVGTKDGLSTLNTWILDSMGKDATQLLRLCIRLLLNVATDILAVRESGIGKTVRKKVCQHTSRDIRTLAEQLVKMWVELYHREKSMLDYFRKNVKHQKDDDSVAVSSTPPACSSSQKDHSQGNAEQATSKKTGATSSDGPPDLESAEDDIVISESEAAAIAQAEACQAAALAAVQAYETAEAERNALPVLPKILSFHKFARRSDSHIDSRKKKRDDVSNLSRRHSGDESGRVSRWPVDQTGSSSNASSPNVVEGSADLKREQNKVDTPVNEARPASDGQATTTVRTPTAEGTGDNRSSPEQIKKALSDYVVQLLTPLYKAKRIQKEAFKAIAKKTTMKVMERDGVKDSHMSVSDYLNCKRKNKIRELVDKFVEKHLAETSKHPGS